jgi:purine catabolism regulator
VPEVPHAELLAALRTVRAHLPSAERDFHLGTSRVVDGHQRLPEAYRQAREALQVSLRSEPAPEVVAFDDIGLARMVAVMTESELAAEVVSDALGPLLVERNGEELLLTLETFLGTNCNIAATARALHFHYNTVRYRTARLATLLGPFVEDAERRAELLTACRLRRALHRDT